MRTLRTVVAAFLVLGLATSAFAGDLEKSIAKAAQQEETRSQKKGGSKAIVAAGTGLFVGGMAVGLYAFMNNTNGKFAEFGEANAVNKKLGAAGVGAAFAGGLLVFLGHDRAKRSPSVTVGPGQVKVSKQLSW
jgi:pilus assembly protein TadC